MKYDYLYENLFLKDSITPMRIQRGLTPKQEKRKDAQHARRQMRRYSHHPARISRPPHNQTLFISDSGIPYFEYGWELSYNGLKQLQKRRSYVASGFSRSRNAKKGRKGNGVKEWGNLFWEEFTKPDMQGKSSRLAQKQKQIWWNQAEEALHEKIAA